MAAAPIMAVGAMMQIAGSIKAGQDENSALEQKEANDRFNANQALTAAKFNADRQSIVSTKHLGAMTAQYGASGVDLNSGSVMAVMAASAANAELDKQNIIYGGQIRNTAYNNQASIDSMGAKNALSSSYFNALTGAIKGGAALSGYASRDNTSRATSAGASSDTELEQL